MDDALSDETNFNNERESLIDGIEKYLETPMAVLGFVWLVLTILEFTGNLSPFLIQLNWLIWTIFVIDCVLKFIIAPKKIIFFKRNWLTVIALAVPAVRILRFSRTLGVLRLTRAGGGVRFVKIVSTFNRGMRALAKSFGRRGFGYVMALTIIVLLLGSAGIYSFEQETSDYIKDYGSAVWWTAMTLTTMGTDYFPNTSEGRLLCLLLAIYGFAVFGYVTATVASFFVEREASNSERESSSSQLIKELQKDVQELKELIANAKKGGPPSIGT